MHMKKTLMETEYCLVNNFSVVRFICVGIRNTGFISLLTASLNKNIKERFVSLIYALEF